jgi:hypothetical protein
MVASKYEDDLESHASGCMAEVSERFALHLLISADGQMR